MHTAERRLSHSHLVPEGGPLRAPDLGLLLQTSNTTLATPLMSRYTEAGAHVHLQSTAFQSQIWSTQRRLLLGQTPLPALAIRSAFANSNLRVLPPATDGYCALRSMEVQDILLLINTRLPAETSRASLSLKVSGGTNSAALAAASSLSCVILCTSIPSVLQPAQQAPDACEGAAPGQVLHLLLQRVGKGPSSVEMHAVATDPSPRNFQGVFKAKEESTHQIYYLLFNGIV